MRRTRRTRRTRALTQLKRRCAHNDDNSDNGASKQKKPDVQQQSRRRDTWRIRLQSVTHLGVQLVHPVHLVVLNAVCRNPEM